MQDTFGYDKSPDLPMPRPIDDIPAPTRPRNRAERRAHEAVARRTARHMEKQDKKQQERFQADLATYQMVEQFTKAVGKNLEPVIGAFGKLTAIMKRIGVPHLEDPSKLTEDQKIKIRKEIEKVRRDLVFGGKAT